MSPLTVPMKKKHSQVERMEEIVVYPRPRPAPSLPPGAVFSEATTNRGDQGYSSKPTYSMSDITDTELPNYFSVSQQAQNISAPSVHVVPPPLPHEENMIQPVSSTGSHSNYNKSTSSAPVM